MEVKLSRNNQEIVRIAVSGGEFADESAVVNDALQLFEKRRNLESGNLQLGFKNLGALADGDIMALAFIVIMEAAKSAREDLKDIMAGVKGINSAKAEMRELMSKVNVDASRNAGQAKVTFSPAGLGSEAEYHRIHVPVPVPDPPGGVKRVPTDIVKEEITRASDFDVITDFLKGKLDSLSEMGEMESLRLQMAMDRLSKLMSTISNLLKKQSDTAQTIIDNLK